MDEPMTSLRLTPSLAALLELLRAAPTLRAPAEQRSFPVYDGGSLRLAVPPSWHEELRLAGERSSLLFRRPGRRSVALRIETSALSLQQSLAYSVEDLRAEVE